MVRCVFEEDTFALSLSFGNLQKFASAGLAIFGIGASVAGLSDALTQFASPNFAQNIVDHLYNSFPSKVSEDRSVFVCLPKCIANV